MSDIRTVTVTSCQPKRRGGRKTQTPEQRLAFFDWRTIDAFGCWIWLGAMGSQGYGQSTFNGKKVTAHRASLLLRGVDVPDDAHVHHLCPNRACVNPEHLEVVPAKEHLALHLRKRRESGWKQPLKTHCKHGHPLSGDNVIPRVTRKGWNLRKCRACYERFLESRRV